MLEWRARMDADRKGSAAREAACGEILSSTCAYLRLRSDHARLTCAINPGPVESRHLGSVQNGADIQIKGKTRLGAD
jgi:hypothetical protein